MRAAEAVWRLARACGEGHVPGLERRMPGLDVVCLAWRALRGVVGRLEGAVPGLEGAVPGREGAVPGLEGDVPGREGDVPGLEGAVPGLEGETIVTGVRGAEGAWLLGVLDGCGTGS